MPANYRTIKIGKARISGVELASTPLKMTLGLMFRKNGRMLFDFPYSGKHGIWMLCMKFPIDMIFADEKGRIVSIVKNAEPLSLNPKTWKIFYPAKPCKYVLETEAGFVKRKNIRIGQKLEV